MVRISRLIARQLHWEKAAALFAAMIGKRGALMVSVNKRHGGACLGGENTTLAQAWVLSLPPAFGPAS